MDIEVIAVLPGGLAVVSTVGLRRVLVDTSGESVAELLPPREAAAAAAAWNAAPDKRAVVVAYEGVA